MTATDECASHGIVTGIELESRSSVFVREHKIAAVLALEDGGPTRLILDAGGHIDVCGSADIWWREIELARLRHEKANT